MAAKTKHRSRRSVRVRRVRNAVAAWLLVQLAHVLTSVVLSLVAQWLHLPALGAD